jgi:hypoxanthine phosphoribosyltransferase
MENVYLSWKDVAYLIDRIAAQVTGRIDALVAVSRGGIVPAGLLAKRLNVRQVFIAAVSFFRDEDQQLDWPVYLQFPEDRLLRDQRILVVDDIWEYGRKITNVRERIELAGGQVVTVVLHVRPGAAAATEPVPDIYGEHTQQNVIYPWQAERGKQEV